MTDTSRAAVASSFTLIKGAMIAALLIGIVDTLGQVLLPEFSGAAVYLLMAVILLWRPRGLFRVA